MAQITLNVEFNFWDILVAVNIQPHEQHKYDYSEKNGMATLIVHDISQQRLEDALANYDHQKYLDNLPRLQPSDKERIAELEQENKLLKAQNVALIEQTEFHEEVLTEIILAINS